MVLPAVCAEATPQRATPEIRKIERTILIYFVDAPKRSWLARAHSPTIVTQRGTLSLPITYGFGSPVLRRASAASFAFAPSCSGWFAISTSAPAFFTASRKWSDELAYMSHQYTRGFS